MPGQIGNSGGKKGRSGPAIGNKNALKNGSQVDRHKLTVGKLPATMAQIQREARSYRRELESLVLQAKGQVSAVDAHRIDAAVGCCLSIGLCRWVLRHKLDKLTASDIARNGKEQRDAKKERARIIGQLGLDRDENAITAIYSLHEDDLDEPEVDHANDQ